MFALVRTLTTAKQQQGFSFILIDMKSAGVQVRPILTISGHHHTNEVFFNDVRVPVANLVGEENRGWDCAKFLLGNERTGIARVGLSKARIQEAKWLAMHQATRNGTLWDDAVFRQRFARLEIEIKATELTAMRYLDAAKHRPAGSPIPMSSILKIKGADTQQASAELMMKAAGPHVGPANWTDNEGEGVADALDDWSEGKASRFLQSRRFHLWRFERNSEKYSDQSSVGAVMNFDLTDEQNLLFRLAKNFADPAGRD